MGYFTEIRQSRMQRIGRLFSSKSVDIQKEIEARYLDGDIGVIVYQATDISAIVDPHSIPGCELLNGEFEAFVDKHAALISSAHPIVLEICGADFQESEKESIRSAIKSHYDIQLGKFQHEKETMIGSGVFNAFMSVIVYIIYRLSIKWDIPAIYDSFNLFFWVYAWTLADTLAFGIYDFKERKKKAAQMASINVSFFREYVDRPYNRGEQVRIMDEILQKN